jgi:hypothetical protein
MLVLAYLGSQCTIFQAADFSRPFIWSLVSGLMRFRGRADKRTGSVFCRNLRKNAIQALEMCRRMFRVESMSSTWKAQTHRDRK